MSKTTTDLAHEQAQVMGYDNAMDLVDSVSTQIDSSNTAVSYQALQTARDFTQNLLLLTLYQEIENPKLVSSEDRWKDFFYDGYISQGNSKQFSINLATGHQSYLQTRFNPDDTSTSTPQNEVEYLEMYQVNADTGKVELADNSYQYKKPLTIFEPLWIPYFKSGKLGEFIEKNVALMKNSYDLFLLDKLQKLISNITFNKTINDTTNTNMYECFANAIYPTLLRMQKRNNDYVINDASQNPSYSNKDDIVMFINVDNFSKLSSGVLTRLFNTQYFNIGDYINKDNIVAVAKGLNIGGINDIISNTDDDWLDTNTIIALEKDAIRHCLQINRGERQFYGENLAIQINLHIWGAMKVIGFHKGFKYTCANLSTIPN